MGPGQLSRQVSHEAEGRTTTHYNVGRIAQTYYKLTDGTLL